MIVTIDGPAGAGKSTVARALAARLGFDFLDTGAMYRAVTFAALRAGVSPDDAVALTRVMHDIDIQMEGARTYVNGEDVTEPIRSVEVTSQVRCFADKAVVREKLTRGQRQISHGRSLVTEGRDQGTIVFPHAEYKFYLTASESARASRRQADFHRQGRELTVAEILDQQRQRDEQDQTRELAPLKPAADAIIIDTTDLDVHAVVSLLERHVRQEIAP